MMWTLAACGGGGGGGGETVSQPAGSSSGGTSGGGSSGSSGGTSGGTGGSTAGATPPPTEYTVTQSTSSSLLKTFTDGVRVYRLVNGTGVDVIPIQNLTYSGVA